MNDDLYNEILENGLGLNSPSLDLTSGAITTLNNANDAVDSLPIAVPPADGVTQELVDNTHAAINSSKSIMTDAQSQMQNNLDNVFSTINSASSVNRLEGLSGCINLTNATGTLMGEADEFINGISATAQLQIDAISDYLDGAIDTTEITQLLNDLNSDYSSYETAFKALLDKELELLNDMANKLQSSSLAKSLELLWSDPCAQAILDQTLSPDIKDILNG
ncbi:hypothetical protein C1S86_24355 [Vibrio parahaemolyticus]|uniref:DUF7217 family protein n=1 Tax=Vibrio parahaemolyticus TaxID=670 RepID=UPI000C8789F0|nr:hypothetical protein [Vibrio parahaemolyticus]PMT73889.1 hypothetical protein C1S97_25275 [Vibrio parahaemolyticus]PMT79089.1 hypothetical protein C1S86_24355 [Vibrio parahaemolyticus]